VWGAIQKLERVSTPFKEFYGLLGGSLPESSSILISGDPGSGKTTLAQQILYDELYRSNPCIIVSYDTFPSNIIERMNQFGWDPRRYQLINKLEIVDCYSATAGVTEGVVPQPFDLTNVSIYLTTVMQKLGNRQVTILLDSLMPIFTEAESKHAIGFIQSIAAKVKKAGGKLIVTLSAGSVASELFHKVESLVDGVVELRMVEERHMLRRYLLVRKMDRRQIMPRLVRFDIISGHGIQLKFPKLGFLWRKPRLVGSVL
jgi:KaiC/GvpD/RAD55 family RecA-like ATPase